MLAFYLLLVGLAGAFASPVLLDEKPIDSPVLLDEQSIGEKIVGGWDGRIEDHPYLVQVWWDGSHVCGGTIIGHSWILSAARCFPHPTRLYWIIAGSTNLNTGGTIHQVSKIVIHPDYGKPFTVSNDISVVQVTTSFTWSNKIFIVNLPAPNQEIKAGTWSTIAGWGALWAGGPSPEVVQIADVPIVDHQVCRDAYGNAIDNGMICAGFLEGGVGACQGDFGGPLLINGTLFGVTAFGNGCAARGYPSVYASVPYYRNWIERNTGY